MQVTNEYQQENKTDISSLKVFHKHRIIHANNVKKERAKKRVKYTAEHFDPSDKSNWRY